MAALTTSEPGQEVPERYTSRSFPPPEHPRGRRVPRQPRLGGTAQRGERGRPGDATTDRHADHDRPGQCRHPGDQTQLRHPENPPQQTVLTLHQLPMTPTHPPNFQQQPTPDWMLPHQTPPAHYAHTDLGNHFLHPTWEQRPPWSRRRRRKRAQGNTPPPSEQGLAHVRSEMNTIRQLMGKMTSDLGALAGCLSTPWGVQEAPVYPTVNRIGCQGAYESPYPAEVEWPPGGQGKCIQVTSPSQPLVSQLPGNQFPQTTVRGGSETYWTKADYSTPGMIRYRFPANPGFHPPDWTHPTQPEVGEYESNRAAA